MPWKLRKAPKRDLYWVVNKETGKKHSKDPLPKETATAQMKALYASETKSGGVTLTKDDFVKEHVKLIDVLEHGPASALKKEAVDQSKELKRVVGGRKKKWIQTALKTMKKGALTQQAARVAETPLEFAKEVEKNPEHYYKKTKKRIQFLKNIQPHLKGKGTGHSKAKVAPEPAPESDTSRDESTFQTSFDTISSVPTSDTITEAEAKEILRGLRRIHFDELAHVVERVPTQEGHEIFYATDFEGRPIQEWERIVYSKKDVRDFKQWERNADESIKFDDRSQPIPRLMIATPSDLRPNDNPMPRYRIFPNAGIIDTGEVWQTSDSESPKSPYSRVAASKIDEKYYPARGNVLYTFLDQEQIQQADYEDLTKKKEILEQTISLLPRSVQGKISNPAEETELREQLRLVATELMRREREESNRQAAEIRRQMAETAAKKKEDARKKRRGGAIKDIIPRVEALRREMEAKFRLLGGSFPYLVREICQGVLDENPYYDFYKVRKDNQNGILRGNRYETEFKNGIERKVRINGIERDIKLQPVAFPDKVIEDAYIAMVKPIIIEYLDELQTDIQKLLASGASQAFIQDHVRRIGPRPPARGKPIGQRIGLGYKTKQTLRGRGTQEVSNDLLQQMVKESYVNSPKQQIGDFTLIHSTPTLKFYQRGNLIVVAIRGTQLNDGRDIKADALAIIGQLKASQRYREDLATLQQVKSQHPNDKFIAVGHSLGGAILDLFLRNGLIERGLSYNGFPEPQERNGNPLHHRIYHKNDFIYKMFARKIPNIEVRTTKEPYWKYVLYNSLPAGFGTAYSGLDSHLLDRFQGGSY